MIHRALVQLMTHGLIVERTAPVMASAPIGPSRRKFANTAVVVRTTLMPEQLLTLLKTIEQRCGRRAGQRWGARSLDLDIILWSGGCWQSRVLQIPHPRWQWRAFVLRPLLTIAPRWRDPVSGRSVRHLAHRQRASRPYQTIP
jgi:2-amino-4-hydroxy-6-hydroxymethyldihydropteridine diphosphokinase